MSTIVTRAGKGSALTHVEVDANFTNLNTDKLQSGNTAASLTITSATITGGALNGSLGATTPSTVVATTVTGDSATIGGAGVDGFVAKTYVGAGFSAIYSRSVTSGLTNYAFVTNGAITGINGSATSRMEVAGNTIAEASSTGLSVTGDLTTTGNTILGNASTDTLNVGNGGLVKDASGNLGLGVTPSAWSASYDALEFSYGALSNVSTSVALWGNAYWNGTNSIYKTTAAATNYAQVAGSHTWSTAPSGTAGTAITFTERMRIDSSGNLGLGVTPVTPSASHKIIELGTAGNIFVGYGASDSGMTSGVYYNAGYKWAASNSLGATGYEQYNGAHYWTTIAPQAHTAGTAAAMVSAMTLDANSKLTVAGEASIHGITVGLGGGSVAANTAVGVSALVVNTTGNFNTAVGWGTLGATTTGGYNAAFGARALTTNTTGIELTACGTDTLRFNTTGNNNTASGYGALYGNTTGSFNTAHGAYALLANTTASNNTAVGYLAGYNNTTGASSTFIGFRAGYSQTTGAYNTFVGKDAGYSVTTGTKNIFIGGENNVTGGAGSSITTGSANTILGAYTGNQGGLDIRTANNYIVLSDGDGNPRAYWSNQGNATFTWGTATRTIFNNTSGTAGDCYGLNVNYLAAAPNGTSNHFFLASDNVTDRMAVRSNGGIANYSANNVNLSDERTKKDIVDAGNYLDKICAIPVRTFLYKDQTDSDLNLGVIAQEVEAVAPELVDVSGFGKTPEDGVPLKAVYQTDLVYALMRAIQELKAEIDLLKGAK